VPPQQSQLLARALEHWGVPLQSLWVPYARHAFDVVSDGLGSQVARAAVAEFLAAKQTR
jgi:dienelactone hydrolase